MAAVMPAAAAIDCSDGQVAGPVALHEGDGAAEAGSFANPWINRHHLFCGDINRRGRAVGFHYRQNGEDPRLGPGNNNPAAARITGPIKPQEGAPGWRIYRGEGIEIWSEAAERYVLKKGFSTFFPDNCGPEQVVASVRYAVLNAKRPLPAKGGQFRGMSGPGGPIDGYCYRRDSGNGPGQPFPVAGFLNQLSSQGWTINTAYPE